MAEPRTAADLPDAEEPKPQTAGDLPDVAPIAWKGEAADHLASSGVMGAAMHAFGQGLDNNWGAAPFTEEAKEWLEKSGVYADGPFKLFNESILRPAVNALDLFSQHLVHQFNLAKSLPGAVGDAAVELGVPKDIVGMTVENPMFAGGPGVMGRMPKFPGGKPRLTGGTGSPADLRVAQDLGVIGEEPQPLPPIGSKELLTLKPITAANGSPYSFQAFIKEGSNDLLNKPPEDGNYFQATIHAKSAEDFAKLSEDEQTKAVEVTHKNGEPVSAAVPAARASDDLVKRGPTDVATTGNDWQARFDQWVTKLQVPDDVKSLIRNASDDNNAFPEARGGQIPEERLGQLSDATGIPRDQMDEAKMRLTMRNDNEFRTAAQIMIKTNEGVLEAARNHQAEGSFESRKAMVVAIMRRDLALEGVLGLRAEWGRTGNVMQEFLDSIKDSQGLGKYIKDKKGEGWNSAKLDEVAGHLSGINSPEGLGRYLSEMRKPDFIDKALWYWTNSILSGFVTHTKYVMANAAYLAHDILIATPLAGVSGTVRSLLGEKDFDRVYLGETVAKTYGLIAGVPDAIIAAGQAMNNNIATPLPPQMRGAGNVNPVTGLAPIKGPIGTAIGIPSRGIAGIHSFFNFLGYRSEIEAQAYRQAVKEGQNPMTSSFWRAQKGHADFPDDTAMDAGIKAGERANFVQDLGPSGKALQTFLYKTRIGRFIMPFTKVPGNIFNAVQEGTPFAYMDERMRSDLLGKNGGVARDMANGRLMGGGAILGYAAYLTLQDTITDSGPVDPKERAEWLLTHQPRSFKFNGQWKSYDQFGPIGGWLNLAASLTATGQLIAKAVQDKRITATDEAKYQKDLDEAYSRGVVGFARWFEEAGTQGLVNFVEALTDPAKTRASNAGAIAATALPFSSFQSQSAALVDPYLRDTQTFVDGIRNRIPGLRETLPVARDWTGAPKANPAYHSIIRTQAVNADPVDQEMQRLDLKPTRPVDNIRGVKLTREQYDDYQDHAGILTRSALNNMVTQPNWQKMPYFARSKVILSTITASRKQAEAYMQAKYPSIISEGVDNRTDTLLNGKVKPNAFTRPE